MEVIARAAIAVLGTAVIVAGTYVDVDGDGTADASHSGILQSGENTTVTLQNLPHDTVSVATTAAGGVVNWTIDTDEVTATEDRRSTLTTTGVPRPHTRASSSPARPPPSPSMASLLGPTPSASTRTRRGLGCVSKPRPSP